MIHPSSSVRSEENKDEDPHGNSSSGEQSSSSPNDSNHFNENPSESQGNEKSSQQTKEKEKEREKEKEKHVRRPMNAFMLFSQEQRAKIHLANPNRDNRNVSKILGEKWYSLSTQEQEQYKIRAKQLRNEHFKQNPSFKWSNSQLNKAACAQSSSAHPKDEAEHCRRSARLQSQSQATQQDKTVSPSCDDRLQAFAQVIPLPSPSFVSGRAFFSSDLHAHAEAERTIVEPTLLSHRQGDDSDEFEADRSDHARAHPPDLVDGQRQPVGFVHRRRNEAKGRKHSFV